MSIAGNTFNVTATGEAEVFVQHENDTIQSLFVVKVVSYMFYIYNNIHYSITLYLYPRQYYAYLLKSLTSCQYSEDNQLPVFISCITL